MLSKSAILRIDSLAIFLTRETKQEKNGKQPRGNNEKETWTQVICIHCTDIERFIQRRSKILLLLAPGKLHRFNLNFLRSKKEYLLNLFILAFSSSFQNY